MLGVRLDEKMDKKLTALSKKTNRPKSSITREALEMYLDEIADFEEALRRSKNPNVKFISEEELRKRLGI